MVTQKAITRWMRLSVLWKIVTVLFVVAFFGGICGVAFYFLMGQTPVG